MALGDQAGKAAVDELISQLPTLETFVKASLEEVKTTIEETVGGALNDITAERIELINDLHGVLDRVKLKVAINLEIGERVK